MSSKKWKKEPTREKPLEDKGLGVSEETAVSEERITELIHNSVKVFEELGIDTKELAPIILSEDTVVDGIHRQEAYPDWPSKQMGKMDPTVLEAVRFILNYIRRRVDAKDMTKGLAAIAEATGFSALQISKRFNIPRETVRRHIPRKYVRPYSRGEPMTVEEHTAYLHDRRTYTVSEALKRQREEFKRPNDRSSTDGLPEDEERNVVGVEGEPEVMSPEMIATSMYYRFPGATPSLIQREIIRLHPNLSLFEAEEITKLAHPPSAEPFQKEAVALECPFCGAWKTVKALKQALSSMRSKNPEIASLMEKELREQGWPR